MKKFLSIKEVTTTLEKSDVEIYKAALENSEKRVDFLRVVGEIMDHKEGLSELLDQMVFVLYQKSIVRKTILGKILYAEKTYINVAAEPIKKAKKAAV